MKAKKCLLSLLVLSSLGLAACNNGEKPVDPEPEKPVEPVDPEPEKPVDPVDPEPETPDVPLTSEQCYDVFKESFKKAQLNENTQSTYMEKVTKFSTKVFNSENNEVTGDELDFITGGMGLEEVTTQNSKYCGYSKEKNEMYSLLESPEANMMSYYFTKDQKSYSYSEIMGMPMVAEVNDDHILHDLFKADDAIKEILYGYEVNYESISTLEDGVYLGILSSLDFDPTLVTNPVKEIKASETDGAFNIKMSTSFDFAGLNNVTAQFDINYDKESVKDVAIAIENVSSEPIEEGYVAKLYQNFNIKAEFKNELIVEKELTEEQKTQYQATTSEAIPSNGSISLKYKDANGAFELPFDPFVGVMGQNIDPESIPVIDHVKINFYKEGEDTPIDINTVQIKSYEQELYFDFEIEEGYALVFDEANFLEPVAINVNETAQYTIQNFSEMILVNGLPQETETIDLKSQQLYCITVDMGMME